MAVTSTDFCSLIFKISCIIGCLFQIQNILVSFLHYGTITRSQYIAPVTIAFPNLHYCFPCLEHMINMTKIKSRYGVHYSNKNAEEWANVFELMDILTIKDMLDFTPGSGIESCSFRDSTGNTMKKGNKSECERIFNVKKYLIQQYVCYALSMKTESSLSFRSITSSLDFERLIFLIRFKGIHARTRKIRASVSGNRYPLMENPYSPAYYKKSKSDISIHISCKNISYHWLGYPNDPFICQTGDIDYFKCIDICLEDKFYKNTGRLPFTSFYDHNSWGIETIKMFSDSMLNNLSMSESINQWFVECRNSCPIFSCKYSFCLVDGHADETHDLLSGSFIRVESPLDRNLHVDIVPQVTFLDCLIYVMSTLGTWFGLVIISCNPIILVTKVNQYLSDRRAMKNGFGRRADRRDMILKRMQLRSRYYEKYL